MSGARRGVRLGRLLVRTALVLVLLLGAAVAWFRGRYGGATTPFPDRSTAPLLPASAVEKVAELPEAPGNLAVSKEGRVFFNYHPEGRPAVSVLELVDGKPVPFPSPAFPLFDQVFSLRIDRQGRLWTLDTGFHGVRQPRLLAFDLATRAVVHRWDLPGEVAGLGSYVQDFQVSPDGRTVYLADLGVMAKRPALIVHDVATGKARRLLERDPSTLDRPYAIAVKGRPMRLLGGLYAFHPALDSIGLDAAGEWLYYGPMSHESLFRVRTRDLLDPALTASELSRRVETYAPKNQSDGISLDRAGNVYLTDVEHASLSVIRPDRTLATLVRDPRWRWPDGLSFGEEDWLYVTDSAIPDIMTRSRGHVASQRPYFIWRLRTGSPGTPGS